MFRGIFLFLLIVLSLNVFGQTGFLTGQESKGLNRICYYNVAGSVLPVVFGAASICPISYDFSTQNQPNNSSLHLQKPDFLDIRKALGVDQPQSYADQFRKGQEDKQRLLKLKAERQLLETQNKILQQQLKAQEENKISQKQQYVAELALRAKEAEKARNMPQLAYYVQLLANEFPNNAEYLNQLGYYLVTETDQYQTAKVILEQAIKVHPSGLYLDSYGWCLFKLRDYEGAVAVLERAYRKHKHPVIASHLGRAMFNVDRIEEAEELLRKAKKKFPNDPKLLKTMHDLVIK